MRVAAVLIFLMLAVACQPAQVSKNIDDHAMIADPMDHVGCHPEERNEEGTCTLAEEGNKNAEIFSMGSFEVNSQDLEYADSGIGYLAEPVEEGTYPGIIMIHEWWGLNENVKYMADVLASNGYVVLAVDLYDGQVATTSDEASALVGIVRENQAPAVANMKAASAYLRSKDNVDADAIASMGWCFGGGESLQLALSGEDLAATIIYYGQLTDDQEALKVIDQPVLGIFGAEDGSIPVDSVNAFEAALNELGVENEIHIYPGVGHAFANPSGERFAPNETKDAWEKTLVFLDEHVKN